jgi:hypothetical protein
MFVVRCFLFCVVDHVRPLPSFDFCFIPLHLWLAIKPLGDPPPSMCPWWGKDYIPWCYSKCFCVHCKRCRVSHLAKINPHFSTAFFSIFSLACQDCSISGWHSHIVWCHHCQPHSIKFNVMGDSFSCGVCYNGGQVKASLYCDHYLIDMFFPLVTKVFE